MTKIMIIPSNKNQIKNLINKVDSFLIGIDDLSINLPVYFDIREAMDIIDYIVLNKKEVFVSLNKNMHNEDLDYLREVINKLKNKKVTIVYYDLAVYNLVKEHASNLSLTWAQEHLTTNYSTINYWYLLGTLNTLISAEITKEDILIIKKNTKSKLIVPIFGYLPMFTSKRRVVSNYLKTFKINKNKDLYYLEKEGNIYPVIDNKLGSYVFSSKLLNGLEEYLEFKENDIDYVLLNSFNIKDKPFEEIIDLYLTSNEKNKQINSEKINIICRNNTDKGFLYKKTVYKVK